MTIASVKKSDYMEKGSPEQFENLGKVTEWQPPRTSTDTVGEVMEIFHNKLPPMPENLAFMFHHNSTQKQK